MLDDVANVHNMSRFTAHVCISVTADVMYLDVYIGLTSDY
jgi:hypothetical protein